MNKKKENGGKKIIRDFLVKCDNYGTKALVRSCFNMGYVGTGLQELVIICHIRVTHEERICGLC